MRHIFMNLCLCATLLGVSACETMMGDVDTDPPYAMERTATNEERVRPQPAPVVIAEPQQCQCDCSSWENRALRAESELAQCREGTRRVRDAHDELLRK
ncbi:MAG: hypothetical protein DHS20C02_09280 [Micavibrio sp.]|nr:MAG: hypothetical protein DHS20C02_09280 [Micavibrio sp.]